ncbi:MAG: hypothetical protein V4694_03935 [Pseudomonadota bacterium]
MAINKSELANQNLDVPSSVPNNASAEIIANLQLISEVFQKIEEETAEMAELIFDYLINATDEQIMNGTIPIHKNKRINDYIKILNRLFLFSRKASKSGGLRIINRETVEELDKKTFMICMVQDGGVSLDILCDIVNTENQARTPNASPVKVTVRQLFGVSQGTERI